MAADTTMASCETYQTETAAHDDEKDKPFEDLVVDNLEVELPYSGPQITVLAGREPAVTRATHTAVLDAAFREAVFWLFVCLLEGHLRFSLFVHLLLFILIVFFWRCHQCRGHLGVGRFWSRAVGG